LVFSYRDNVCDIVRSNNESTALSRSNIEVSFYCELI
jgi:hypothetical protein